MVSLQSGALVYLGWLAFRPSPSSWPRSPCGYLSTTRFATFIQVGRANLPEGWVMAPSVLALTKQKTLAAAPR